LHEKYYITPGRFAAEPIAHFGGKKSQISPGCGQFERHVSVREISGCGWS
jgi:hypothetical protein